MSLVSLLLDKKQKDQKRKLICCDNDTKGILDSKQNSTKMRPHVSRRKSVPMLVVKELGFPFYFDPIKIEETINFQAKANDIFIVSLHRLAYIKFEYQFLSFASFCGFVFV